MRECCPDDGCAGPQVAITQQMCGEPGGEEQTVVGPQPGLAAHELCGQSSLPSLPSPSVSAYGDCQ